MKKVYKYTTEKEEYRYLDYLSHVTIELPFLKIINGHCYIKEQYAYNGCTPKFKVFGKVYGTPDGKNNECKYATLWHDVIYQYCKELAKLGVKRLDADLMFYRDLIHSRWEFANLYYQAVRIFGWITWGMQRKDNSNIETNFS